MNPMDEKGLGSRLQAARKSAGMTQQMLCQKATLSYSTLAKIERGAIKSPSIFTIQSIATALGTSLDVLIGNDNSAQVAKPKKLSKNGVSFVYFDINGCLVRSYHHGLTKLASESGASLDAVESAFWHYNDEVCRGTMSMSEFNSTLAKRLNFKDADWAKYYLEAVVPIKEMQDLVRWTSEHYKVGLFTNIMPGLISSMNSRNLLPQVAFDAIVDSSQVGAIKPEAKIYDIANERAQTPPNEILLIDDTRANLMAAEKLGWHVLWFDDYRPKESVDRIRESLEVA